MTRFKVYNIVCLSVLAFVVPIFVSAVNNRQGICTLEVPTIDLLSPHDRQGPIPRGNGSRPTLSKIDVCCSGYTRLPHTHYGCVPICEKPCENGNCTAPNVCQCKVGYIKNHQDRCVPTCPLGCENGVCTRSNVCSCNMGYELSRDGKYCLPVCRGGCGVGGECLGNDQCKCGPGYQLNPNTRKCEFYCEGSCGEGGACVGPNTCSCKQGYIKQGISCVAGCPRGCKDGECIAPNLCRCKPGWNLDRTGSVCVPHCTDPCLNGDCVAPNECSCHKGYVKPPGSPSYKCVADCPGGCPNGECTSPGFCICNPGYVKERKGSQNCVRRTRRSAGSPRIHYELIPEQLGQ